MTSGWVRGFLKRHTELSMCRAVIVDTGRRLACTRLNLMPFYRGLSGLLESHHFSPQLIFNIDETSINFSQRYKSHIIRPSIAQSIPFTSQPDRVESCTLVICVSPKGDPFDSTLLWPQSKIPEEFSCFPIEHIS